MCSQCRNINQAFSFLWHTVCDTTTVNSFRFPCNVHPPVCAALPEEFGWFRHTLKVWYWLFKIQLFMTLVVTATQIITDVSCCGWKNNEQPTDCCYKLNWPSLKGSFICPSHVRSWRVICVNLCDEYFETGKRRWNHAHFNVSLWLCFHGNHAHAGPTKYDTCSSWENSDTERWLWIISCWSVLSAGNGRGWQLESSIAANVWLCVFCLFSFRCCRKQTADTSFCVL